MFAFEGHFRRGIWALIAVHVTLSFSAIYLLERFAPDQRHLSMERGLRLRVELDKVLLSIRETQINIDPEAWNQAFREQLLMVENLSKETGLTIGSTRALQDLSLERLERDPQARRFAQDRVLAIAREYDNHWELTLKNYHLAVLGGSWSIAVLSLLGFLSIAIIHKRMKRSAVVPFREVCLTLMEWKEGNLLRRCSPANEDPQVTQSLHILNGCLDEFRRPLQREIM